MIQKQLRASNKTTNCSIYNHSTHFPQIQAKDHTHFPSARYEINTAHARYLSLFMFGIQLNFNLTWLLKLRDTFNVPDINQIVT